MLSLPISAVKQMGTFEVLDYLNDRKAKHPRTIDNYPFVLAQQLLIIHILYWLKLALFLATILPDETSHDVLSTRLVATAKQSIVIQVVISAFVSAQQPQTPSANSILTIRTKQLCPHIPLLVLSLGTAYDTPSRNFLQTLQTYSLSQARTRCEHSKRWSRRQHPLPLLHHR